MKFVLSAAFALASGSVIAAEQISPPQESRLAETEEMVFAPPTLDQVKAARQETEAATNLEESDKKNVLSALDQAIRFLEESERINADTLKLTDKVKNAPARIKEIETQLNRKITPPDQIVDLAGALRMTNPELEQREREERTSLSSLRESLKNFQDQIEALKARPMQLQKESVEVMRRLGEVRKELKGDSTKPNETRLFFEARRTRLLAEHLMLKTQIQAFEQQLINQEILASLISAERDLVNFQITQAEARSQAWQAIAQERRQQEAIQKRMDAEIAKDLAPELPQIVKDQYEINISMGKDLEQLTDDEARAARELDQLQAGLKKLEEEFAQIRRAFRACHFRKRSD
jgi:hypothetical protein